MPSLAEHQYTKEVGTLKWSIFSMMYENAW
jgi:hypothetical protein